MVHIGFCFLRSLNMNNKKITAIYVRRSVSDSDKGNNSISIAAQKADCIKFITERYTNSEYRVYCDDGKSGKDVEHRPAFQEMMAAVKAGEIGRIVVKKYDRFSRNMREYLNITNELDKLGIGVISLSEPFDTETKEGRMMRNNLLNFAEFERETIAARVADAYSAKARETGFYQGGQYYFGYISERRTVNGKVGSVLVPSPQAYAIQKAYELYANPEISLNDIILYFKENDVNTTVNTRRGTNNLNRSHLSKLLSSPLYVRANAEVYHYFASKGIEMMDDISEYDGSHGLFLHRKHYENTPLFIKVGYHEGLVDADTWLAVQDKKSRQSKFGGKEKAFNSWLAGLVKCAHCGYALIVNYSWNVSKTKLWRYYRDNGYICMKGCVKPTPKIHPDDVENAVFEAMKERLNSLEIAKKQNVKSNPQADETISKIARIECEIKGLMEKLAMADKTLFEYIQRRISELDSQKSELEQKLQRLQRREKAIDTAPLTEPLAHWDELTMQEKRNVAGQIIEIIYVSDETGIDIHFSI